MARRRITDEPADPGTVIDRRTVGRHLSRLGLGRPRFIDPSGGTDRRARQDHCPPARAHGPLGLNKACRIPDGGGRRVHGRNSDQAKVTARAKTAGAKRGHIYLHSIVDGHFRLVCIEPLDDEKGFTAAAFLARARVWFAHGINHIQRIVTDNGACRRSGDFARIVGNQTRHQKTKPCTARHNGTVARHQRVLAEELLCARDFTSEDARSAAIAVWNIHYNCHRPHSGADDQPPASRLLRQCHQRPALGERTPPESLSSSTARESR